MEPLPLSETFFSDRIGKVTPAVSAQLFRTLKDGNMLDGKALLKDDPRCFQHNAWNYG